MTTGAGAASRLDFIRRETRIGAPPHVPEIRLHLASEAVELWQKTEQQLEAIGLPPPFWAFAWAGGQALARYILDNPGLVAGRRVLDFASGSGLVAIAAAKAGAAHVEASDIDAFALAAISLNAASNGVVVTPLADDLIGSTGQWDVILAGDICYQKDIADPAMAWLSSRAAAGIQVLIGDPGRAYLPKHQLEALAEYQVPVTRALEDMDIKKTTVWRFKA